MENIFRKLTSHPFVHYLDIEEQMQDQQREGDHRMTDHVTREGVQVAAPLARLIEEDVLLDTAPAAFWRGYAAMLRDLMPVNVALLSRRAELQHRIDDWHRTRRGHPFDAAQYRGFLREIGYLEPAPEPFEVTTEGVDPEIASVAGPQLVVPVTNARFALNAANARWGSLYDALYGTDAIPGAPAGPGYDPARGRQVIAWARAHLDHVAPLAQGSWADVTALEIADGRLRVATGGDATAMADPAQFAGHVPGREVLLRVNGMLIRIVIDRDSPIGRDDPAGIADVLLESALTVIQDCEDSVACVDPQDKCRAYANWLGLMRGDLEDAFEKAGRQMTRRLAADVAYTDPQGNAVTHPGRALMLVRNVGHLMTTDAVLLDGAETPEGMLDAAVTVAAAMHDLRRDRPMNSRAGSIYVVKPKMHGPDEVRFADTLYARVEDLLGLPRNTVKLGVMDEERRSSANLAACIRAVRARCVFINTGFLDRTGDEIHTSMQAGPVIPRGEMQTAAWLAAYEAGNVDTGLAVGLTGRGQIGKGMWAKPEAMAEMLEVKIGHPRAGASTAWVPSPTAATLHATHYHRVDVRAVQNEIRHRPHASAEELLTPPLLAGRNLSEAELQREVENACQSILGYVVRWVDQGIGCSKVPDIDDIPLMEDRATLRIASQHLANWLLHGICPAAMVEDALRRMAERVDAQNAGDPDYRPMAPGFDGAAFNAARDLIFLGAEQPSGYTEPLLHAARRRAKAEQEGKDTPC